MNLPDRNTLVHLLAVYTDLRATTRSVTDRRQESRLLSQGKPRDAALNFDTHRILQRHRAVSLPQHGFLVRLCPQSAENADLLSKVSEEVATEIPKNVVADSVVSCPLTEEPQRVSAIPHIPYISESKIIDLYYAADSMGLSSFKFFWWAPYSASFL